MSQAWPIGADAATAVPFGRTTGLDNLMDFSSCGIVGGEEGVAQEVQGGGGLAVFEERSGTDFGDTCDLTGAEPGDAREPDWGAYATESRRNDDPASTIINAAITVFRTMPILDSTESSKF